MAEILQSQASLKEGALLQPAKHPLLPDSQYLWQVTLVQQKEFGSFEAYQASRAIIPLTEAKAKPLYSALRTDYACSRLSPEELALYKSETVQSVATTHLACVFSLSRCLTLQTASTWLAHASLRFELLQHAQLIMFIGFTCLTRCCSEPTPASRFCLILMPLGARVIFGC